MYIIILAWQIIHEGGLYLIYNILTFVLLFCHRFQLRHFPHIVNENERQPQRQSQDEPRGEQQLPSHWSVGAGLLINYVNYA